ncbi:MAG: branched-chain amino acid ABC transporter permease [Spirochaetia bacterium]|nr:branched-chain amino acid ABC transporter permease [Spirochaetia bacterium]
MTSYLAGLFSSIGIYLILGLSLNLALGFTGLLSLGHVAFFGIGAYTSALLATQGIPFPIAFLSAGIVSGLAGGLLAFPIRKLRGDYLSLATLAFHFVVFSLATNLEFLTRGPLGIAGISRPLGLGNDYAFLGFVWFCVVIVFLFLFRLTRSPFGRLLEGVRDDEALLRTLGKNTLQLKFSSLFISAFLTGIAGSLFSVYVGYINPGTFNLEEVILALTLVIVGGVASLPGTVIATVILMSLPEMLRFLPLSSEVLGPLRQMLYAVILLAILRFRPRGILGKIDLN